MATSISGTECHVCAISFTRILLSLLCTYKTQRFNLNYILLSYETD